MLLGMADTIARSTSGQRSVCGGGGILVMTAMRSEGITSEDMHVEHIHCPLFKGSYFQSLESDSKVILLSLKNL